jgi:hypothetical protein
MIAILSPAQINKLEIDYPSLDPRDIECDIVYNSKATPINIPDCFLPNLFKELYGVSIDQITFKDNNKSNWEFKNINFRY